MTTTNNTTTGEPGEKTKQYPRWHDFVSGAVAGAGARVLTHPLDLIRIRRQLAHFQAPTKATESASQHPNLLQAIVNVVRNEGGIPALFRGNMAAMNLWVGYTAVQFYSYGHCRDYFITLLPGESNRGTVAFLAGASAGVAATLSTYPLDLCRTIFAARGAEMEATSSVSNYWAVWAAGSSPMSSSTTSQQGPSSSSKLRPPNTMLEFVRNLHQRRGLNGFFAGCLPTVIQIVPYMGCSFYIYDTLTHGDRAVSMSAYAGSIAGAVSKLLVYPMDTVKKRLQAQAFFGAHDAHRGQLQLRYYTGILDCVATVYRTEGLLSFYRGLWPTVLKTSLAAGLSFAMFRTTQNTLESIHDRGGLFVTCDSDQSILHAEGKADDKQKQQPGQRQQQLENVEEQKEKQQEYRALLKRRHTTHFD